MKVFQLKRSQILPIPLADAWAFFSTPANLEELTPAWLGFTVTSDLPDKIYPGLIITYQLKFYGLIPISWTTEITHTDTTNKDEHMFVDEQRFGPYAFWHHQHHFKALPADLGGGTECTDIVHYALPFWFIGEIGNAIMVRHQLAEIFTFRQEHLRQRFGA